MSTRSNVGIKEGDKFKYIYVHFDGYPTGVGATLRKHYTDPKKVEQLISLGACSVLGEELEPERESFDYDSKVLNENGSMFYGRDRGEKGVEAKTQDWDEYLKEQLDDVWIEYIYVFENGKWKGYSKDLYCPIMDEDPEFDDITDEAIQPTIKSFREIADEEYEEEDEDA